MSGSTSTSRSLDWFARVTGGRWLSEPKNATAEVAGVGIDTRTLGRGDAFVAIAGPRFDGHDFIVTAAERGAAVAVVEREVEAPEGVAVLLVEGTIAALQAMASAWRDVLEEAACRVIAVAGSNGKTTTRHLIYQVLSRERRGTQSPKSFNNHLGVPLTLLGASVGDDFVVVEVGTNHPGEVDALARIVRPDAAVITSIGEEHLEFFGDISGVAKEEASLLRHVRRGGAAYVAGAAMEHLSPHLPGSAGRRVEAVAGHPAVAGLALPGAFTSANAALAAHVGTWMGLNDATIRGALADATLPPGRWEVHRLAGGVVVIDDGYNANPSSMRAAVEAFAADASIYVEEGMAGRRVAVLGDMLELGEHAAGAHRAVGAWIADAFPSLMTIFIGPLMSEHTAAGLRAQGASPLATFPQVDDATFHAIADLLQPRDRVLLKGSRGIAIERVLGPMGGRFGV